MELVIIAWVGTALLMVAELREFVGRRRFISGMAESSSALFTSARTTTARSWAAENENFYDAAA